MNVIVTQTPVTRIVAAGIQGPPGPPGFVSIIGTANPPTTIGPGELAYSTLNDNLYLSTTAGTSKKVGGYSDVLKLSLSTALSTAGTLVQRDNNGSVKFNNAEVNSLTLNGNVSSTSSITSFCADTVNQTINIGSVTATTLNLPSVVIKSSLTNTFKITDENNVVLLSLTKTGVTTLKDVTANSLSVSTTLGVAQGITGASISTTTGTIGTLGVTTLNATAVNANTTLSAGSSTLTSLIVNQSTRLKGGLNGLNDSNAKTTLENFNIDGNSNLIKVRTSVASLNDLTFGELYINAGNLYFKDESGNSRFFLSVDSTKNLSVGNIIIENALKIDSTTSTGGLVGQEHIIDSFSVTEYRSAKYVVQVSSGTNYQSSEVLVIHNGTESYLTEYGFVQTNGTLCEVETRIEGGLVKLVAYGNYNNLAYRVIRNTIAI